MRGPADPSFLRRRTTWVSTVRDVLVAPDALQEILATVGPAGLRGEQVEEIELFGGQLEREAMQSRGRAR